MLETTDLILDKGTFEDWRDMYVNVWSRPESARYMMWSVTTSEADAQARMLRTIEFQKSHDTYTVYERATRRAIGFAGVEELEPGICHEEGICLGPDYVRRGYGRQILGRLIEYSRERYHATEFRATARERNEASNRLIRSMGFQLVGSEQKLDDRDGSTYTLLRYRLTLPDLPTEPQGLPYETSCGAVVYTVVNGEVRYVIIQSIEGIHGFPKGHMEPGESEEQTALREIWEEVGLKPRLLDGFRLVDEHPLPQKPGTMKRVVYFLAEYHDQVLVVQESELRGAQLLPYRDAYRIFEFESSRHILQQADAFLRR